MGDLQPKRRINLGQKIDIPLAFQLVLLLRARKELMYLCTKSSLALRVSILCELAIDNLIELKNGMVEVVRISEKPILNEITRRVSEVKMNPVDLLKYLNGEHGKLSGMKNLRKKTYSEMQGRGLIRVTKKLMVNKIAIQNTDAWHNILEKIVYEVQSKKVSKETIVLLMTLNYINGMESLLIQCNETVAGLIVQQVEEIKQRVQDRQFLTEDGLMYQFLSIVMV